MKVLLFIALVLPACLAIPTVIKHRIVGGYPASSGQFPHQISLQVRGQHICGGSVISSTKILTAAHCIYGSNDPMDVVAGITNLGEGGQRASVARAVYHQSYEPSQIINDVAVLTLATPLTLGGNVRAITLRTNDAQPGETLTLSGWGLTSYPGSIPQQLQYINLRDISLQECAQQMVGYAPITTGHVCTSSPVGQGACQGDSGGPLIDQSGRQIGIVSWGIPCAKGKPDVFTSAAFYYSWIIGQ